MPIMKLLSSCFQVVVTSIVRFADVPVQVRCPNCHRDVMTNLEYNTGMLAWLIVLLLCVLGFWW